MEELLEFVQKVKSTLEDEVVKKSYIGFNDFPCGACMDASILLGVLLEINGFGEYQLVSASNEKGNWFSHAWLENDEYFIDITADQFHNWPAQPLALKLNEKPKFYHSFKIQFRDSVLQHSNVTAHGYYMAMSLVARAIQS
jgi:hypothetical protein